MTSDRPKLIYVAQRHPRYTHEAFIQRWRQHAALGMSQARWRNVARYLHCDRVEGLPASLPALDCDGVAIVVYRSRQAREVHVADENARRIMKADELDTFAQPVADTSMLVREVVEREGPLDRFRLFVFRSGADATDRAPLDLLAGTDVALTRNDLAGSLGTQPWTEVDELASASIETLGALASELQRSSLPASEEKARFVLTRTVVLHDVRDPPALPGDH
jgi:hypothetical protein